MLKNTDKKTRKLGLFLPFLWLCMANAIAQPQCNWWGTEFLLCEETTTGWGWESNRSCISESTCDTQPPPYGIVYDLNHSESSVSNNASISSSSPLVASSSAALSNPNCADMCKWYNDAPRPLCQNQNSGWGWENQKSCIGINTCNSQGNIGGVISLCEPPLSSSSTSTSSTSTSSSSNTSSTSLCEADAITPYLRVNQGAWQQTGVISIQRGDALTLGPNPRDGEWQWEGCGTQGRDREQIIVPTESCRVSATYTNNCGTNTTYEYSIDVANSDVTSSSYSSSSTPLSEGYRAGEFILGMDISYWSEQLDGGTTYIDTDGQTKDLLDLFKNHGINFIRLRTFVDPTAPYGYTSTAGGCSGKPNPYNGKDDIIRMAKKIKAAGMGFLLDFHYSDTWADPGKQVIPQAWQNVSSVQALAEELRVYTVDVLTALQSQNALPDMVQVGNEITPGMLVHEPTSNTDCWGNNSVYRSGPNGGANNSNWHNLGLLLKAGIQGVKHVDASIKTVLHIENFDDPAGIEWWVDSALNQNIDFDVLGLSSYEEFQGPASAWRTTIQGLSSRYPQLSFAIVEYNPQARLLNDIMREVPNGRGLGTFFWEPTESGYWGNAIFTQQGNSYRANASDFAVYDGIVEDYELRILP